MAKQPTPQGISTLLRQAGFTSAQRRLVNELGGRTTTEGYRVHRHGRDAVVVGFVPGREHRGLDAVSARFDEMLNAYAEAIEAAGWHVRRDEPGYTMSLIVRANEEA